MFRIQSDHLRRRKTRSWSGGGRRCHSAAAAAAAAAASLPNMRISVAVSLWWTSAILHLVNMTLYEADDLESSGYELLLDFSGSGSGSGDWSVQGLENHQDSSNVKSVRLTPVQAEAGPDDSEFTFENPWPTDDQDIVLVANSKSLMERQEVFAAVVAGAVTGVVLASTLASFLIYKSFKKSDVSYILGQQKALNTY